LVGAWSEYVKCSERYVALKPKNLSFGDAASLPLAGVTALQVLRKYEGSLEGKTVFIPAGRELYHELISDLSTDVMNSSSVSGTGAFACQLAKNIFGAGKVITTVSTSKIAKIPELLGEGVVDQGAYQ
jgi:NADPH:quinone reductase-like Zn-dependent oxidoreductase